MNDSENHTALLSRLATQNEHILADISELKKDVKSLTLFREKLFGMGLICGTIGALIVEFGKDLLFK